MITILVNVNAREPADFSRMFTFSSFAVQYTALLSCKQFSALYRPESSKSRLPPSQDSISTLIGAATSPALSIIFLLESLEDLERRKFNILFIGRRRRVRGSSLVPYRPELCHGAVKMESSGLSKEGRIVCPSSSSSTLLCCRTGTD